MQARVILSVENIYSAYGKKEILKGVSVNIKQEEIVALVGPNGAGKSTLLKAIIGLLSAGSGKIFFEGREIASLSSDKRSNLGIGYLFQGGAVFTNLTVLENLKLALANINTKNRNNNLEKIFTLFPELEQRKPQLAGLLSGGLKSLLSLGIILIREPKLLLLDEPSAGLSPALVKTVVQKVKEINQTEKITILLVEQNIRQAVKIAHRAYLMKAGKVVREELQPELLLNEANFEKVLFDS